MKDQYNNPIPDDLVTMPDISLLSVKEVNLVDNADWYEANGILLVSSKAINFLSEDDPLDSGINLADPDIEIFHVEHVLHRFNFVDGFYHA
jgi:hypothetical protein